MIHVKLSAKYRYVPFDIEIDGHPDALYRLGNLIDQVKHFIDAMLSDKVVTE